MSDYRTALTLSREAEAAGLVVLQLTPQCEAHDCYRISLWSPDGKLWAEGTHEEPDMIRDHISSYRSKVRESLKDLSIEPITKM